jgi:hypothetical protein
MTRTVAIIAAMFALVSPSTFNYDTARANMVEQTQYHSLPILNPQNFENELAAKSLCSFSSQVILAIFVTSWQSSPQSIRR